MRKNPKSKVKRKSCGETPGLEMGFVEASRRALNVLTPGGGTKMFSLSGGMDSNASGITGVFMPSDVSDCLVA